MADLQVGALHDHEKISAPASKLANGKPTSVLSSQTYWKLRRSLNDTPVRKRPRGSYALIKYVGVVDWTKQEKEFIFKYVREHPPNIPDDYWRECADSMNKHLHTTRTDVSCKSFYNQFHSKQECPTPPDLSDIKTEADSCQTDISLPPNGSSFNSPVMPVLKANSEKMDIMSETLPEKTFCTWLSENFTEDKSRQFRLNITLESILGKASDIYPDITSQCSQLLLYKLLEKMYPGVKRTRIPRNGIKKVTVKGIKFDSIQNAQIVDIQDNFLALSDVIPQEWIILDRNSNEIKLCRFSADEFYNGNAVQTHLLVDRAGSIQVLVAGKKIDLSDHFISTKVVFNRKSVSAMFRCLNTLALCRGFEISPSEHNMYTVSQVALKEIRSTSSDTETSTVIRHIGCKRVRALTSALNFCTKCTGLRTYRRRVYVSTAEQD